MLKTHTNFILLATLAVMILILVAPKISSAQPGTETDPVVSLSYMESALALSPVRLEGGEDLRIASGRGIILLDGTVRIVLPAGRGFRIVDVTSGEIVATEIDMVPGHMYIPVSGDNEPATVTLLAWQSSTLALPGGIGR